MMSTAQESAFGTLLGATKDDGARRGCRPTVAKSPITLGCEPATLLNGRAHHSSWLRPAAPSLGIGPKGDVVSVGRWLLYVHARVRQLEWLRIRFITMQCLFAALLL